MIHREGHRKGILSRYATAATTTTTTPSGTMNVCHIYRTVQCLCLWGNHTDMDTIVMNNSLSNNKLC